MVHVLGHPVDMVVFWVVISAVCVIVTGIIVLIVYVQRKTARTGSDVMRRDMDRMAEYRDGLSESEPAVRHLFKLGVAAMDASKWDEAIGHFQEALIAAKGTELVALFNLTGVCHYTQGRLNDALGDFEESARLAERFGDEQGNARALGNLGVVCHHKGELDKALQHKEEALARAHDLGDQWAEAVYLGNIGNIWHDKRKLDKALEYHERALAISRDIGDEWSVVSDLVNIASVYHDKGGLNKALKYNKEALTMARKIGDKLGVATDLGNIGVIYHDQGDLDKALRFEEEALGIAREIGYRLGVATDLGNIGLILTAKKEYEQAVPKLAEALAILLDTEVADGPRQALSGLVRCENKLGRKRMEGLLKGTGLGDKALADLLSRIDARRQETDKAQK